MAAQGKLSADRWQEVELHDGILWETLGQIISQFPDLRLLPACIPSESDRQRRYILGFPAIRECERSRGTLSCFGGISEQGFPQSRCGFIVRRRLFLFRPNRGGHRLSGELSSLRKPAGIAGCFGLEVQQGVFRSR